MPKYLVVDDDPSTVRGVTSLLEGDGHEVHSCTSGAEAIAALEQGSFDAVMTDLEMPRVDGHAVVRTARLRQPEACVIVASARAHDHHDSLVEAGACIISDKPIDYDDVTRAVTECRGRGGPGAHGRCHMRSRLSGESLVRARRD